MATVLGTQPITNPAEFRALLPEFSDATKWSDAVIQAQIDIVPTQFNARVWGSRLREGMANLIAHKLILSARAAALPIGQLGAQKGLVSSKSSVGGSISYDLGSVTVQGAAGYNLTSYGAAYYQMLRWSGAGAAYI